ncbi:TrmB family transcriptional regulator [Nanoarchaeota archaeon]
MQEETLRVLENIGLSKNEAKVYFTLIKTGLATATEIAKESKLHRPNVYDSLKALIEKGLVSHIIIEKTKRFKAAEPKRLGVLMKQRELDLLKVIPMLNLEAKLAKNPESVAEVHHGLKAFRTCLFNLLDYRKPLFAFGIPKIVPKLLAPFISQFHRERIKRKVMFRHIYNEDAKDRIKYLNTVQYTEAAYLPERFNSPVSTIICGPEVFIVRWDPVVFTRIIDESLARTYQAYCEHLLDVAKKS